MSVFLFVKIVFKKSWIGVKRNQSNKIKNMFEKSARIFFLGHCIKIGHNDHKGKPEPVLKHKKEQ